ncbi:hypothetical protein ACGFIF_44205 [Kribbella sp. NPDC049174]|uniref:hypothetical protein n=1 Tax=Kribbella sp. NPDC049174 TaxID=3364112 RepID=UPI00371C9C37
MIGWLDLDDIVDRIHERGVWAYVEMTGGGVATIFAGAWHTGWDGEHPRTVYAAVAGPGDYRMPESPNTGHTDEFNIGADDQGETFGIDCAELEIASSADVADLIVAQARLPLGKHLTARQARRILQGKPLRWPPRWLRVRRTRCHPSCSCRGRT